MPVAQPQQSSYSEKGVTQRQNQLRELARTVLAASPADQTELRLSETDIAITRFAKSRIEQDSQQLYASATITARFGQREGRSTARQLDPTALSEALEQAVNAARGSAEDPYLADLPSGPQEYPFQVDFFESTASSSPAQRAKLVEAGLRASQLPEFTATGSLRSSAQHILVANSRGIEVCFSSTFARFEARWQGPSSSGFSENSSRDISALAPAETAVRGLAVARRSANPRSGLPAGKYSVILGPDCIASLLGFLGGLAFNGRSYIEGNGALSGLMNSAVCSAGITISDDPLDERLLALPCDFSGLPRIHLPLIEGGVARGVAHDLDSAKRAGTTSTGHATEQRVPLPASLVLAPGPDSLDQLIEDTQRGIYIKRFSNCSVRDPLTTTISGLTADGCFMVENGEISGSLANFSFTESILPALGRVSGIAGEQQVVCGPAGNTHFLVPEALRIEDFDCSGN